MKLFETFIAALLIDNVVLMRFLGLCPFIGMSSDEDKSFGMGIAVTFVTVLSVSVIWPLYTFILLRLHLEFLKVVAFILVIAGLVQIVEFYLKKTSPGLYNSMGIYFALISTNCAILGTNLEIIEKPFIEAIVYALGVSLGFLLSLLLLAGIRKRIRTSPIPAVLKGSPILFVSAGLLSMVFMGFSGLIK